MKITKKQLIKMIKEAQFGRFTGGAAPLDVPMRDSGPVPKDQLRKLADIFMNDMGMSPEEVLEKPEFVEQGITDLKQLEESKMKITKRQLRKIIKEERERLLLSESVDVKDIMDLESAVRNIYGQMTTQTDVDQTYAGTGEPVSKDPRVMHDKAVKFITSEVMDIIKQVQKA